MSTRPNSTMLNLLSSNSYVEQKDSDLSQCRVKSSARNSHRNSEVTRDSFSAAVVFAQDEMNNCQDTTTSNESTESTKAKPKAAKKSFRSYITAIPLWLRIAISVSVLTAATLALMLIMDIAVHKASFTNATISGTHLSLRGDSSITFQTQVQLVDTPRFVFAKDFQLKSATCDISLDSGEYMANIAVENAAIFYVAESNPDAGTYVISGTVSSVNAAAIYAAAAGVITGDEASIDRVISASCQINIDALVFSSVRVPLSISVSDSFPSSYAAAAFGGEQGLPSSSTNVHSSVIDLPALKYMLWPSSSSSTLDEILSVSKCGLQVSMPSIQLNLEEFKQWQSTQDEGNGIDQLKNIATKFVSWVRSKLQIEQQWTCDTKCNTVFSHAQVVTLQQQSAEYLKTDANSGTMLLAACDSDGQHDNILVQLIGAYEFSVQQGSLNPESLTFQQLIQQVFTKPDPSVYIGSAVMFNTNVYLQSFNSADNNGIFSQNSLFGGNIQLVNAVNDNSQSSEDSDVYKPESDSSNIEKNLVSGVSRYTFPTVSSNSSQSYNWNSGNWIRLYQFSIHIDPGFIGIIPVIDSTVTLSLFKQNNIITFDAGVSAAAGSTSFNERLFGTLNSDANDDAISGTVNVLSGSNALPPYPNTPPAGVSSSLAIAVQIALPLVGNGPARTVSGKLTGTASSGDSVSVTLNNMVWDGSNLQGQATVSSALLSPGNFASGNIYFDSLNSIATAAISVVIDSPNVQQYGYFSGVSAYWSGDQRTTVQVNGTLTWLGHIFDFFGGASCDYNAIFSVLASVDYGAGTFQFCQSGSSCTSSPANYGSVTPQLVAWQNHYVNGAISSRDTITGNVGLSKNVDLSQAALNGGVTVINTQGNIVVQGLASVSFDLHASKAAGLLDLRVNSGQQTIQFRADDFNWPFYVQFINYPPSITNPNYYVDIQARLQTLTHIIGLFSLNWASLAELELSGTVEYTKNATSFDNLVLCNTQSLCSAWTNSGQLAPYTIDPSLTPAMSVINGLAPIQAFTASGGINLASSTILQANVLFNTDSQHPAKSIINATALLSMKGGQLDARFHLILQDSSSSMNYPLSIGTSNNLWLWYAAQTIGYREIDISLPGTYSGVSANNVAWWDGLALNIPNGRIVSTSYNKLVAELFFNSTASSPYTYFQTLRGLDPSQGLAQANALGATNVINTYNNLHANLQNFKFYSATPYFSWSSAADSTGHAVVSASVNVNSQFPAFQTLNAALQANSASLSFTQQLQATSGFVSDSLGYASTANDGNLYSYYPQANQLTTTEQFNLRATYNSFPLFKSVGFFDFTNLELNANANFQYIQDVNASTVSQQFCNQGYGTSSGHAFCTTLPTDFIFYLNVAPNIIIQKYNAYNLLSGQHYENVSGVFNLQLNTQTPANKLSGSALIYQKDSPRINGVANLLVDTNQQLLNFALNGTSTIVGSQSIYSQNSATSAFANMYWKFWEADSVGIRANANWQYSDDTLSNAPSMSPVYFPNIFLTVNGAANKLSLTGSSEVDTMKSTTARSDSYFVYGNGNQQYWAYPTPQLFSNLTDPMINSNVANGYYNFVPQNSYTVQSLQKVSLQDWKVYKTSVHRYSITAAEFSPATPTIARTEFVSNGYLSSSFDGGISINGTNSFLWNYSPVNGGSHSLNIMCPQEEAWFAISQNTGVSLNTDPACNSKNNVISSGSCIAAVRSSLAEQFIEWTGLVCSVPLPTLPPAQTTTPAPVSPQNAVVTASIILLMDFNTIVSELEQFDQAIRAELASAMGVDESRVQITSVQPGSIIVGFTILPPSGSGASAEISAVKALQNLAAIIASGSASGTYLSQADPKQNIFSTATCTSDITDASCNELLGNTPNSDNGGSSSTNTTTIIIAVVLSVIGALLLIAFLIYWIRRRSAPKGHYRDASGAKSTIELPAPSDCTTPTATKPQTAFV